MICENLCYNNLDFRKNRSFRRRSGVLRMREEDKNLAESLEKELENLFQDSQEGNRDPEYEELENRNEILDPEQQPEIAVKASAEAIDRAMDKIIEDTIGNIPVSDDMDEYEEEYEDDEEDGKSGGAKKVVIGTAIVLGALVLAGGGFYGWKAFSYKDRFYEKTVINQVDCSNLTVDEAEELIRKRLEDYELAIHFRGDKTVVVTGEDINYHYVSDGKIQMIKEEQNPLFWIKGLFKESEYEVGEEIQYEESMLQEKLNSLQELNTAQMIAPADAYVDYKENAFVVVDEVEGNTLKPEDVFAAAKKAIAEGATELNLEEQDFYEKPKVLRDNPELMAKADNLNQLVKASITYQLPNETLVLDGNTLIKWLDVDANGNYTKNDEVYRQHISDFVDEMAAKVNTLGGTRKFRTHGGSEVNVKGGSYGWKIDREKEIETLTRNLANNETVTREPEYSSREVSTDNSGLGGTYVEIDMTKQHLWLYQDGSEVYDTPVVTGRMTTRRYTPAGTYYITEMKRDKTLIGETLSNGEPEYRTPVAYWMRFNGGIGLHDATWQASFGGQRYLWAGSHGCINLPLKAAEKIYGVISNGTPVICYYTHEYTLTPEAKPTPKPTAAPKPTSTPKPTAKPTTAPKPTATPKPTSAPEPTDAPSTEG